MFKRNNGCTPFQVFSPYMGKAMTKG